MAFDPARVKSLFLAASDLPSTEDRAAYLDRECGGEPDLRARVEALLAAEDRAGPIPGPTDLIDPARPPSPGVGQWSGSETLPGSDDTALDAGPSTAGTANVTVDSPAGVPGVVQARRGGGFVAGQVIAGRYTLLEVLGEGGMGTVYRAEQSRPVRRQVALKLIKGGMDSGTVLARFDAERQALAMMDHPNIARVFDGGATDANRPFFVMELVQGVPITDYCDRHRLPVDARLRLFVAVCQAVQHAHQKGIIHRDLKPSNVMVAEVDGRPTPKVIDFGVAKATEARLTDLSLDDTGAIVGTPIYMSPEQADPSSMDIDTRTDVYALGVILYELLAGSTPLDASRFKRGAILEMLRMVREVEPSKPSTKVGTADALPDIAANRGIDPERLKRRLRGDLDWIAMKALEKDRSRRYETANGFAADILLHLASEPVLAAPPSPSYRLRKFVRRHRAGVFAASLVLLTLLAGILGTTLGLLEAMRQEERAQLLARSERDSTSKALIAASEEAKAKETAEAVLKFVETKVFAAARPKNEGGLGFDVTLAEAVTAALPAIEEGFPGKPLTEARLRRTIGDSFLYLGRPEIAAKQYEVARSLYVRHRGPDHLSTLECMTNLANSYSALGRQDEALKLRETTLARQKIKLGPNHPETLKSMGNLANSYLALGRHRDALKLYEETRARQKSGPGAGQPGAFTNMINLANAYQALGRPADALELYEETLALMKVKLGPDHTQTLKSMGNLATNYISVGRHDDARKLLEETLARQKAKLGPDHPDTFASMLNLANTYGGLGRDPEALKLREETLALMKAKLGPDHPNTLASMANLVASYLALDRPAEALELSERTLPLMKAKLGPDHLDTLKSMANLAGCYLSLGRHAEAIELYEEALARQKAKLGPDHPDTLTSMHFLAYSKLTSGRYAEAIKLYEEALPLMEAKLGPDHPTTLTSMTSLAAGYLSLGRHAEAIKLYDQALALTKAKFGPDHPETLGNMANLADSYLAAGRLPEGISILEEASHRKDGRCSLTLAALRLWLGQQEGYVATRGPFLKLAGETNDSSTVSGAVIVGALQPSTDPALLESVLDLGRKATGLNKGGLEWMALGMAEYRNGHFAAADEALLSASKVAPDDDVAAISAFYRAMGLFQAGKKEEARGVATEAAARMSPLPKDVQNPLLGDENPHHLIVWLAFREAKALIGFEPPPAPTSPHAK